MVSKYYNIFTMIDTTLQNIIIILLQGFCARVLYTVTEFTEAYEAPLQSSIFNFENIIIFFIITPEQLPKIIFKKSVDILFRL